MNFPNRPLVAAWPVSAVIVERLGWVLVHSLWPVTLLALLATGLVRAMQRKSAATRYGLLVVSLAISVCMPITTWLLQRTQAISPSPPAPISAAAVSTAVERAPDSAPVPKSQGVVASPPSAIPLNQASDAAAISSSTPPPRPADETRQTSWSV